MRCSEERAALMLMHALKRVEQGHTSTKGKLKHFFAHAASEKLRSEAEQELWAAMEWDVSAWLAGGPDAHFACIEAGCNCYGPKRVGAVRGGTFSNRLHGRLDFHLEYNAPHKPL